MQSGQNIAVVTGGNRGLGFETVRQLSNRGMHVIFTVRSPIKGEETLQQLGETKGTVEYLVLDVTHPACGDQLASYIEHSKIRVDVLVNNAGIFIKEKGDGTGSILTISMDNIRQTMETNAYAPMRLIQAVIPFMKRQGFGNIINVSSGMGALQNMSGGSAGYRISKTALNAITKILAEELKGSQIYVNSVSPGWVRTDMGGAHAPRTLQEGVDTIVWLASQGTDGPQGSFSGIGKKLPGNMSCGHK